MIRGARLRIVWSTAAGFVPAVVVSTILACAPGSDSETPEGELDAPSGEVDAPAGGRDAPVAGGATSPDDDPTLRIVSERTRDGGGYDAFELSGANKPNGIEQRFRRDVPDASPAFVPRSHDGLDLWIAERQPDGAWLAFYRSEPRLGDNSEYHAALYGADGAARWSLDLNPLLSRPTQLEIHDLRYDDGALFFNEACQSYSREAGGDCSALVKIDPSGPEVVWRSSPRTSNGIFLLRDAHIVAGYGFTAEPDSLFLVSRASGERVASVVLDSQPFYLEMRDGRLVVVTNAKVYEVVADRY